MKLLFLLLAINISLNSIGQLTKGIWLLGGSGKLYSYSGTYRTTAFYNTSKNLDVEISPSIGYFLIDKFALGLRPAFSWIKGNIDNGAFITNVKRFSLGPFARYYFLNTEKPYNIVADISYQYGTYAFTNQKGTIKTLSIMAGPVIYFNTSIGLEFLLGYSSKIEDVEAGYKDTRKGFQIGLGFQIHLEK